MKLLKAEMSDLSSILELQYLAYQSEAKLNNNYSIPPLMQTLEEIKQEYEKGIVLKVIDENRSIIGSVRGYVENDTLYIGKLIVHPGHQGRGIGTQLLNEIEKVCPQPRYELFTSDKSIRNIKLYERLGYVQYQVKQVAPNLKFIYLEKNR